MPFQPGDVIRMWDDLVEPPAFKRFVVIWPEQGWLLRVNTRPIWRPHWALSAADNPGCFDHDCWLELNGILEFWGLEEAEYLGTLAQPTIDALVALIPTIMTFSEEQAEAMVAQLG